MSDNTEYSTKLEYQTKHLAMWETRLQPQLFADVKAYVLSKNDPATGNCYRGQDIVQIIMQWPDLSPVYPPVGGDVI